jgi:hypothetical protein
MKTLSAVLLPALLLAGGMWMTVSAQDEKPEVLPAPLPGQISETELGEILATIGLKPTKIEQRYDFAFKTSYRVGNGMAGSDSTNGRRSPSHSVAATSGC